MSALALGDLAREGALEGLSLPEGVAEATLLDGHASRRRFVRLSTSAGETSVLMVYPAEESADIDRYLRVARWLVAAGVRVPKILDRGERAVLVEDAGDLRLDRPGIPQRLRERAYRQASRAMELLAQHGRRVGPPNPRLALDRERLRTELEFFERHTMCTWLDVGGGREAREAFYDRLADAVAALPTGQCHRDFHSRNLMLHRERIVVVDFQDQMEGPLFYDAASLALDDYRDVEPETRAALMRVYWNHQRTPLARCREARMPPAGEGLCSSARQAFCLVALQRSLKALGTFGFQVAAGNTDYARYAPRTWAYARRSLALLGWSDVRELTVPLERAFG